jgi:hypothetical protein
MANAQGIVDLPEVSGSWEYVTQYLSRWADRVGLPANDAPLPTVPLPYPPHYLRSAPLRPISGVGRPLAP